VCGDTPNETVLDAPGRVVASYTRGSTIEMSYFVTTNHLGRFNLQLCKLGATSEAECSAPLQRCGAWRSGGAAAAAAARCCLGSAARSGEIGCARSHGSPTSPPARLPARLQGGRQRHLVVAAQPRLLLV
jgi:hypothetical protein